MICYPFIMLESQGHNRQRAARTNGNNAKDYLRKEAAPRKGSPILKVKVFITNRMNDSTIHQGCQPWSGLVMVGPNIRFLLQVLEDL
jgi:hypothetical protein